MRKMFVASGIALLILAFALPALGQAIHGCVNRKGTLRIVGGPEDCQNNETYIVLNLEGPQGPPGPEGPQGPAGLACWDLNGDQSCDPAEDKNKDGQCDVSDCQGGVFVYDSSSPPQFLGVFLGYKHAPFSYEEPVFTVTWVNHVVAEIFVPSLNAVTYIRLNPHEGPRNEGEILKAAIFFESAGCIGNAGAKWPNTIFGSYDPGIYYVTSQTSLPFNWTSNSFWNYLERCIDAEIDHLYKGPVFSVTQIPVEEIPFSVPITLPLVFR